MDMEFDMELEEEIEKVEKLEREIERDLNFDRKVRNQMEFCELYFPKILDRGFSNGLIKEKEMSIAEALEYYKKIAKERPLTMEERLKVSELIDKLLDNIRELNKQLHLGNISYQEYLKQCRPIYEEISELNVTLQTERERELDKTRELIKDLLNAKSDNEKQRLLKELNDLGYNIKDIIKMVKEELDLIGFLYKLNKEDLEYNDIDYTTYSTRLEIYGNKCDKYNEFLEELTKASEIENEMKREISRRYLEELEERQRQLEKADYEVDDPIDNSQKLIKPLSISETGKRMLQFQSDVAEIHKYKLQPPLIAEDNMKQYFNTLPEDFKPDKIDVDGFLNVGYEIQKDKITDMPLYSRQGTKIADTYDRIVIGHYGAFIEIDPKDMEMDNVQCEKGQSYRINNPHYANRVKYQWFTTKDDTHCKLYFQQKGVVYADYKPDKWYISPYEVMTSKELSDILKIDIDRDDKQQEGYDGR